MHSINTAHISPGRRHFFFQQRRSSSQIKSAMNHIAARGRSMFIQNSTTPERSPITASGTNHSAEPPRSENVSARLSVRRKAKIAQVYMGSGRTIVLYNSFDGQSAQRKYASAAERSPIQCRHRIYIIIPVSTVAMTLMIGMSSADSPKWEIKPLINHAYPNM